MLKIISVIILMVEFKYIKTEEFTMAPDIEFNCRERNRLIGTDKSDLYLLISAKLNDIVQMECHFCRELDDYRPKIWYHQDQIMSAKPVEVALGMESQEILNKFQVTSTHTLTIRNVTPDDGGFYYCHGRHGQESQYKYNYLLDPIFDVNVTAYVGNISHWAVYRKEVLEPANTRLALSMEKDLHKLRDSLGGALSVLTQWQHWGPCQICGRPQGKAERERNGFCRLRTKQFKTRTNISAAIAHSGTDKLQEKFIINAFQLSCRSVFFGKLFPGISAKTRNLADYVEVEPCAGICTPGSESDKGRKSRKKKSFKYKKTYVLAEDAHLTLVCPESTIDSAVVWKKDNKRLEAGASQSLGKGETEPHLAVDTFSTLYLLGVTDEEGGNYTCTVDGTYIQQVTIIVVSKSKLLTMAFLRHMAYLGFVLTLSLSCYCAGLCIVWRRRRRLKRYETTQTDDHTTNTDLSNITPTTNQSSSVKTRSAPEASGNDNESHEESEKEVTVSSPSVKQNETEGPDTTTNDTISDTTSFTSEIFDETTRLLDLVEEDQMESREEKSPRRLSTIEKIRSFFKQKETENPNGGSPGSTLESVLTRTESARMTQGQSEATEESIPTSSGYVQSFTYEDETLSKSSKTNEESTMQTESTIEDSEDGTSTDRTKTLQKSSADTYTEEIETDTYSEREDTTKTGLLTTVEESGDGTSTDRTNTLQKSSADTDPEETDTYSEREDTTKTGLLTTIEESSSEVETSSFQYDESTTEAKTTGRKAISRSNINRTQGEYRGGELFRNKRLDEETSKTETEPGKRLEMRLLLQSVDKEDFDTDESARYPEKTRFEFRVGHPAARYMHLSPDNLTLHKFNSKRYEEHKNEELDESYDKNIPRKNYKNFECSKRQDGQLHTLYFNPKLQSDNDTTFESDASLLLDDDLFSSPNTSRMQKWSQSFRNLFKKK